MQMGDAAEGWGTELQSPRISPSYPPYAPLLPHDTFTYHHDPNEQDLRTRFPAYPWDNSCTLSDHVTIVTPSPDNPATFGCACYKPVACAAGILAAKHPKVPHNMWHPLASWISTLRWSTRKPPTTSVNDHHDKQTTWLELTLVPLYLQEAT